jgi:hypothetical protein
MLKFFPRVYEDEIAYSIFARYGVLNGNPSSTSTSNELFGIKNKNHSIYYPVFIDNFINQLPAEMGITSENFIKKNTIFPLFKPFMTKKRAELVTNNMRHENMLGLYDRIGIHSGDIFKKYEHSIKICPLCFKEEVDKYGEAYAHRLHQIPGNFICEKHEIYLHEYQIPTVKSTILDINDIDIRLLKVSMIEDNLKDFYLKLSHDINYVLNGGYEEYNKERIQTIYRNVLYEKGYLQRININQRKLMDDFVNYYPKEFLTKLESDIDMNNNDNWLTNIATDKAEYVHPIRHLLFIRFLFGNASSFLNTEAEYKPFGEGPWPCLNHAADHFKELVIDDCKVKSSGKRKGLIGYFKCSCGFEYTRKGPDISENDKFRYTSISQRGEIWENKLRDLLLNTNLSLTELEKEMRCSRDTILKNAIAMGIYDESNTVLKYKPHPIKKVDIELYKKELVEFIKDNPEVNRTRIKENLTKQYVTLYKYEKDWLESVLPKPFKDGKAFNMGYKDEDWIELDKKLYNLVNDAVADILNDEKNQRITINKIKRKINYLGLQSSQTLEKLPNTKELLRLKCETFEQYHNRTKQSV